MISPIIADRRAAIKTAPAAMSFIIPALGLNSGLTKSTICSMAVFKVSSDKTNAQHTKTIHHSIVVMPKKKPITIANEAIVSWILKFLCCKEILIPFKAKPNDLNNLFTVDKGIAII